MIAEIVALLITALFLIVVVAKVSLRFLASPEVGPGRVGEVARPYRAALEELGFTHVGDFQIRMSPGADPTPFAWLVRDDGTDQARVVVQSKRAFVELQRRFESGFSVVTDNGTYARVFDAGTSAVVHRVRTRDISELLAAHDAKCAEQDARGDVAAPDVDEPEAYIAEIELAQLRRLEERGTLHFDRRRDQYRMTWGGTVRILGRLLTALFTR